MQHLHNSHHTQPDLAKLCSRAATEVTAENQVISLQPQNQSSMGSRGWRFPTRSQLSNSISHWKWLLQHGTEWEMTSSVGWEEEEQGARKVLQPYL